MLGGESGGRRGVLFYAGEQGGTVDAIPHRNAVQKSTIPQHLLRCLWYLGEAQQEDILIDAPPDIPEERCPVSCTQSAGPARRSRQSGGFCCTAFCRPGMS